MNNNEIEQAAIERYGHARSIDEIDAEEMRSAVAECRTWAGVRLRLGLGSANCSNADVKKKCREWCIDGSGLENFRASLWENIQIKN